MSGPVAALLADGRLHLQHGPIDLIVGAAGAPDEIRRAYAQVTAAFDGVLERLVEELPLLRTPVGAPPTLTLPHSAQWQMPLHAGGGDKLLAEMPSTPSPSMGEGRGGGVP